MAEKPMAATWIQYVRMRVPMIIADIRSWSLRQILVGGLLALLLGGLLAWLASGLWIFDPMAHSGIPRLQQVQTLQTPGPVSYLIWSRDGTKLAASILGRPVDIIPFFMRIPGPPGRLIMIWDANGQLYRELHRPDQFIDIGDQFAFVAGDRQLVAPAVYTSDKAAFSVFDLDSGEVVRELAGPFPDKPRYANGAHLLLSSPDQSLLAVTFGLAVPEQSVALYSTRDWERYPDLPTNPMSPSETLSPRAMAFSNDGHLLAAVRGGTIVIYDVASKQIVQRIGPLFDPGYGLPAGVALSPDGGMIAVALSGIVRRRDGAVIATNSDAVAVFSTRDGSRIAFNENEPSPIESIRWSQDGIFIAFITRYRTLHLWSPLKPLPNERSVDFSESLALALSPDGMRLAVSDGERIKVFRLAQ